MQYDPENDLKIFKNVVCLDVLVDECRWGQVTVGLESYSMIQTGVWAGLVKDIQECCLPGSAARRMQMGSSYGGSSCYIQLLPIKCQTRSTKDRIARGVSCKHFARRYTEAKDTETKRQTHS